MSLSLAVFDLFFDNCLTVLLVSAYQYRKNQTHIQKISFYSAKVFILQELCDNKFRTQAYLPNNQITVYWDTIVPMCI